MRAKRKDRTGLLVANEWGHQCHRGCFLRHIRKSRRDAFGTPSSSALFGKGCGPVRHLPQKSGRSNKGEATWHESLANVHEWDIEQIISLSRRNDG